MYKLFQLLLFLGPGIPAFAQQKIELSNLRRHHGDSVTVCGQMMRGRYDSMATDRSTSLFIGGLEPNHQLTVLIDADSRKKFALKPEEVFFLKNVCITGKVKVVQLRPSISINKPEQIVVREQQ